MKKLKFKTIVSVFLSAVVFWSLAVPMMSYATPADFSGNQGFLLAEDIEELEQKVAPGPDYEEGDLIAFKVIDVPLETFDTVGQTPSLRADCTEKPTCQVVLHKIATSNGKCQIDFRCTLASMMTCVRIKGVSGSYTCKDTSNEDSYRQSFNEDQIVPSGGFTAYVDGEHEFNASHRIWVSWQFTAQVYNYAYGNPGYSGTESL